MTQSRPGARVGILLVLLTAAPAAAGAAPAEKAVRALLERAVRAHGGRQRLEKLRADRVTLRGTLRVGADKVPFVSETTVQPPGQFRSVVRLTRGGTTHTLVQALDGGHALFALDGREHPVPQARREELRRALQLDRAVRLLPLLTDPSLRLEWLGEATVNGRTALGVKVTALGGPELRLYFDKEQALLAKSEHQLPGPDGKAVRHETYYGAYRDVGGIRRPGKVVGFRDGTAVLEAELADVEYLDSVEPDAFRRP
jgi:hypothetical protein